ncbi:putative GNAT family N-acetyltransferase, partial [Bombardia bombarda]
PSTPPPSLPKGYTLHAGIPAVPEYLHVRASSGLRPKTASEAAPLAKGSWWGCYITYDGPKLNSQETESESSSKETTATTGPAVAMGRIIGDGGWYFLIADMAVLPEHQRKGLGDVVLKQLLAYIKANAADGDPFVTLLADPPGRKLYGRNGFVDGSPALMGMHMELDWRK